MAIATPCVNPRGRQIPATRQRCSAYRRTHVYSYTFSCTFNTIFHILSPEPMLHDETCCEQMQGSSYSIKNEASRSNTNVIKTNHQTKHHRYIERETFSEAVSAQSVRQAVEHMTQESHLPEHYGGKSKTRIREKHVSPLTLRGTRCTWLKFTSPHNNKDGKTQSPVSYALKSLLIPYPTLQQQKLNSPGAADKLERGQHLLMQCRDPFRVENSSRYLPLSRRHTLSRVHCHTYNQ